MEAVTSVESAGARWLTTETMQLPPSVKFDPLVRTCVIKVHLDAAFRQQHRNSSLLLSAAAAMRGSKLLVLGDDEVALNDDEDCFKLDSTRESLQMLFAHCCKHSCVDQNRSSHGKFAALKSSN